MLSKQELIKKYKKHYKPVFLLAWAKFLTYDELVKTDNMEVLEKAHMLDNGKEWDKSVISYNQDNLVNALCIALDIAIRDITLNNGMYYMLYYDDVLTWLKILGNAKQPAKKLSKDSAMSFYHELSDEYHYKLF